ncbi:MAG: glutathione synthase, partial [Methylophilaceae bacterium]|nr:glutathione synthase [Methylophilaceae bacterium]
YLTEINVTSPTGIVEITAQTDCAAASVFLTALTAKLESQAR